MERIRVSSFKYFSQMSPTTLKTAAEFILEAVVPTQPTVSITYS